MASWVAMHRNACLPPAKWAAWVEIKLCLNNTNRMTEAAGWPRQDRTGRIEQGKSSLACANDRYRPPTHSRTASHRPSQYAGQCAETALAREPEHDKLVQQTVPNQLRFQALEGRALQRITGRQLCDATRLYSSSSVSRSVAHSSGTRARAPHLACVMRATCDAHTSVLQHEQLPVTP